MVGYSLETRLADQVVTQQQKLIWSKDSMNSTINQRLVEQTQEITLSWKVVEVLPWMTPRESSTYQVLMSNTLFCFRIVRTWCSWIKLVYSSLS